MAFSLLCVCANGTATTNTYKKGFTRPTKYELMVLAMYHISISDTKNGFQKETRYFSVIVHDCSTAMKNIHYCNNLKITLSIFEIRYAIILIYIFVI